MCKQFGIKVVKGVAAVANFFLFVTSLGVVIKTSMVYAQFKSYGLILDPSLQTLPLVGLALSSIVLVTVCFGFFGILLNAFGMICFYITLMVIAGLACGIAGCWIHSESKDMQGDLQFFTHRIDQSPNITQDEHKMVAMNAMQMDLMCCGFLDKYQFNREGVAMPSSCCKDPTVECSGDDIWDDSCIDKLEIFGIITSSEEGTMLLCLCTQCIMMSGIGYVLAMAIRQYYYY